MDNEHIGINKINIKTTNKKQEKRKKMDSEHPNYEDGMDIDRDVYNEYCNQDKDWTDFQLEKLSKKSPDNFQKVMDLRKQIAKYNESRDTLINELNEIKKRMETMIKPLETQEKELRKKTKMMWSEYRNFILPECTYCAGPSYSTYCGRSGCW